MNQYMTIKVIFKSHNGIVYTSDITSQGIHNTWLNKLMDQGVISKIRRGVYEWVESGTQEDTNIIKRLFPDAIICMNSALFIYGYTDRTPDAWHLVFNRDINKKRLQINYPHIVPYYMEPHLLAIGVTHDNVNGIELQICDRDRTICDILRHSEKIDREVLNKSIQNYLKDNKKNIQNLIQYSKSLRVYSKVQQWIGVWL
ncbi:MAG: type IV toxin-antitoxin system AbiEi family antitoxin domain-containing protein [Clostridia bacterium]